MTSKRVIVFCIVVASLAAAMGTLEDEEQECVDQLANLASCIPFVSGTAKKPTPECCEDTRKVKATKPKCLCVLIKESTDPSMGLPVNTTLAVQMPSACNINDAKVSDCPSILDLPPNSPDAKIFKEADPDSTRSTTSSSSPTDDTPSNTSASISPTGQSTSSPSSSSGSTDSKTDPSSNGGAKLKISETLNMLVMMVVFVASWKFI
ncbi:non-specific lipid transfer protein GPI-anchored 14 [Ziziphus jujuba]|uniref:Non-specific lipid transfer protein GPI-anchored 14 n=1 Tax=Ziziphus jujuba TaxID=326968 RepID=A0A6P4B7I4_ZIZJJ|nr:non-specific lipid transfer protein GPI-anchored 14 [Ziziphus jujuba]